jgi:hypothetical protein
MSSNTLLSWLWIIISLSALGGAAHLVINGHFEQSLLALTCAGVFRGLAILEREFGD